MLTVSGYARGMLILKRHNIKCTPENIAAVRTALRGVTGIYKPPSDTTTKLAELLMKAPI